MKRIMSIPLLMVLAGGVNAADVDDLDVTIDLIAAGEEGDALMNRIELPAAASEQARERARHGLDTANEARSKHRDFGQEMAAQMRQSREQMHDESADKEGRDSDLKHQGNRPENAGPPNQ